MVGEATGVVEGVVEAAGAVSITCGGAIRRGVAGAPGLRIRNATFAGWPATTVTLSSENPRFGCHARIRYLPTGTSGMLNEPLAAVFAAYG